MPIACSLVVRHTFAPDEGEAHHLVPPPQAQSTLHATLRAVEMAERGGSRALKARPTSAPAQRPAPRAVTELALADTTGDDGRTS